MRRIPEQVNKIVLDLSLLSVYDIAEISKDFSIRSHNGFLVGERRALLSPSLSFWRCEE